MVSGQPTTFPSSRAAPSRRAIARSSRTRAQQQIAQVIGRRRRRAEHRPDPHVRAAPARGEYPEVAGKGPLREVEVGPVRGPLHAVVVGPHGDHAAPLVERPSPQPLGGAGGGAVRADHGPRSDAARRPPLGDRERHAVGHVFQLHRALALQHARARVARGVNDPGVEVEPWHHAPVGRERADLGQRAGDEHLPVHGERRAADRVGRPVVRPEVEAEAGELGQRHGADEVAAHLVAGEPLLIEQPDPQARPAQVRRRRRAGGARADDRDVTVERTDGPQRDHGAWRSSRGSMKRTLSRSTASSSTTTGPRARNQLTTPRARSSGALAPAVTPTADTARTHPGSM